MHTFDAHGLQRLLEAAEGTVYYPIIHLAAYTGLRRGELLGLRWKDVDLDVATLSVIQTMQQLRDRRVIYQEPKTAKGRRLVVLSPGAALELRAHKERQAAIRLMLRQPLGPDDLVFSQPDGSPVLPDSLSQAFWRLATRAGLRPIRFHDLRHTHASLMLRQGVHPKIVSERLGHATIAITLDTYSHVTPGLQEAAALRFEEGLARDVANGLAVPAR